MTRKEVKELLLPLMQAFVDGKEIEYFDGKKWIKTDYIVLKYASRYRIKSEQKYKPFKTKEECWNEMLKHQPFGWVVNKTDKHFCYINFIYDCKLAKGYGVRLSNYQFADIALDYERVLKDYEFVDGKPFGIKEE